MPAISVIVPVYNVEKYLHRCVDSILAQTFTDFELILVDDGSPDNCPAICDEYKEKDSRVIVIHQQNGGLSAARNAGIDWAFAHSDSEWLFFVDSDDWIHPMSLESLINGAIQTGLDVVIGGFDRTERESPVVDTEQLLAKKWDTETFSCDHIVNAVIACGKLYRKVLFSDIRYPFGKQHEDEFTTYKILFKCKEIAVIQQPLYAYFQNPNSIMGVGWNSKRLDAVDALEERIQYFKQCGNIHMYKHSAKLLLINCSAFVELSKVANVDEATQKMVRKIFMQKIKKYHKDVPILNNEYIYERAYPRMMAVYWRVNGFKQKVGDFLCHR